MARLYREQELGVPDRHVHKDSDGILTGPPVQSGMTHVHAKGTDGYTGPAIGPDATHRHAISDDDEYVGMLTSLPITR